MSQDTQQSKSRDFLVRNPVRFFFSSTKQTPEHPQVKVLKSVSDHFMHKNFPEKVSHILKTRHSVALERV